MTGEEDCESGVSRREAVKTGTFATAGLLGLSSLGAESARAQSSEPRIRLGDEWVIDPDGDDFSIEHSSLGVSFVWDESAGYWVPGGGGFDMDGGDIVDDGTTVYDASTDTVGDGSTSADHQSIDTDELFTTPSGVLLTKTSNQSIPNSSQTTVTWDQSDEYNSDAPNFADLGNNAVTIPNGDYSRAKVTFGFGFGSQATVDFIVSLLNGSNFQGQAELQSVDISHDRIVSAWISVSNGDSFTIDLLHSTGGAIDVLSGNATFLEVVAF
jgi:hypothetical protein